MFITVEGKALDQSSELFVGEYLTIICQRDSGKLLCAVTDSGKTPLQSPFLSSQPYIFHLTGEALILPQRILGKNEHKKAKTLMKSCYNLSPLPKIPTPQYFCKDKVSMK